MTSLTLSLDTKPQVILQNVEEIQRIAQDFTGAKNKSKYTVECEGYLTFYESTADYRFDTLKDLKDAMSLENLQDIYIWRLSLDIKKNPENGSYVHKNLLSLEFGPNFELRASKVVVSDISYSEARSFVDQLCLLLDCKQIKISKIDEKERKNEELKLQQSECIGTCIGIFERLPELQARMKTEFKSEIDVQDFLYPILKSHFPKLQEEDYLSKVAGTASKPDFGIEELGIAIELKYISAKKTFPKLTAEINDDSRKYFGKSSPFKLMLVLIYNGASKPTPANFIPDLENIDVITNVTISPNIVPEIKLKQVITKQ